MNAGKLGLAGGPAPLPRLRVGMLFVMWAAAATPISNRLVSRLTPALLEEYGNLPSEMCDGSLYPVPVRVPLLLYNVLVFTFGRFPTGHVRWVNVKGSDVIRANKRRGEQSDRPHVPAPSVFAAVAYRSTSCAPRATASATSSRASRPLRASSSTASPTWVLAR